MISLDSSALMKLIRREDETDALSEWLNLRVAAPGWASRPPMRGG